MCYLSNMCCNPWQCVTLVTCVVTLGTYTYVTTIVYSNIVVAVVTNSTASNVTNQRSESSFNSVVRGAPNSSRKLPVNGKLSRFTAFRPTSPATRYISKREIGSDNNIVILILCQLSEVNRVNRCSLTRVQRSR